jgi:Holliday junction resolvase
MRKHGRTDANQSQIISALRLAGAWVEPNLSAVGGGCPDLLVAYQGYWLVIEVKTAKGKLLQGQQRWHDQFGEFAPVHIARSPEDIVEILHGYQLRRAHECHCRRN